VYGARIANGDGANEHEIFLIEPASGVGEYEIAISIACMCVEFVADACAVAKRRVFHAIILSSGAECFVATSITYGDLLLA
jgi:hypothetical protein